MSTFYDNFSVLAGDGWSWRRVGLSISTINEATATLAVATLVIICFSRWAKKLIIKTKPPPPPGPPGLPIIGNLPFIKPDFLQYVTKQSQIYGPIIKLHMGSKIYIVISSPSIAKEILRDHDATFANRDTPVSAINGSYGGLDIVWRSNGPELHKLRKLVVREIMCNKGLDACYELRRREIRQMVKYIYGKTGSSINLSEQIFLTTLSVTISMLWGGSLNGEEAERGVEFKERLEEFVGLIGAPNVSDIFPVLRPFDLQGIEFKSKKLLSWFYEFLESVIEQRRKVGEGEEEESKDFLQQLLELSGRGDAKASLSMQEVKALLLDMIVGGTDTTFTTMEWAMTELLRHPDKLKRVTDELDAVVGDQNVVEETHLPRLLYLEAVVKETFRIHPPAPLLLPHMAGETTVVAGYTIPKHSNVFFNVWAIQRDPELWENPLRFEPERFMEESEKRNYLGNSFHLFPFGSGRRICVGIPLAEKLVMHILATLVHSFEWGLPDGEKPDIKDKLALVLAKEEPLVVVPIARLSNSQQYQ
ncbi:cytochrome P450, family 706, subfamily A, polypeptide 4 [Hibiscus trionum]|uniref:Cytochrome P450, family 706, subfamily A, polypeptide 4 n=1 Tax=Hibiscus trionum TaxID=183268 RepID=A0A9W7MGV9_HIBTR|nr:cytochrome P450, family 706, subfamily A, polypeptide 4 [Hibiscus trionum]